MQAILSIAQSIFMGMVNCKCCNRSLQVTAEGKCSSVIQDNVVCTLALTEQKS